MKAESDGDTPQTIFLEDAHQLSVVGHGLTEIPSELGEIYGPRTKRLDLTNNSLKRLKNLEKFTILDSLVLDINKIDGTDPFPSVPTLKTLCINDNKVEDIQTFVENVQKAFPNLTYLSLLKNPCCPNYFVGKDFDDYRRYRLYVVYRSGNLKFLDSSPVTEAERKEAKRVGQFVGTVARPKEEEYAKRVVDEELTNIRALPQDLRPLEGPGGAQFGVSKYVYYGRQSEGNRFILNSDL